MGLSSQWAQFAVSKEVQPQQEARLDRDQLAFER